MNIILYGNDTNRMRQKVEALKKQYKIEYVLSFDATKEEQSNILNEMDSVTIFDEPKMIVVDQSTFLSAKDTTKYDIEAFIRRSNEDQQVIVIYCCPAQKLDGRKKLVKKMQEVSKVIPCMALDQKSQPALIQELLKKHKLEMQPQALDYFIANAGMNPMNIENDIRKLKTYADTITLKDVKALVAVAPNEDIFKMVNALFEKQTTRFLQYYRSFRQQGMEPVAIVALLAGQIRFLYQVRVQMDIGYNQQEIASHLKAHPYRVKMSMQRALAYRAQDLLDQLEELSDFDQKMKKGLVDKDQGVEQWVFQRFIG